MKINKLVSKLYLTQLTQKDAEKDVTGVYIGDLLSIVMDKCKEGDAWITAQTHANILNVADLNDAACIILAGGATPDESLLEKAEEDGIIIMTSDKEAYELAWRIHEVLK